MVQKGPTEIENSSRITVESVYFEHMQSKHCCVKQDKRHQNIYIYKKRKEKKRRTND